MQTKLLQPRKEPRQARAAVTLENLLEAATRVLTRESLAGFNTNRVAAVAGVSVGSLYQYFPNKTALVVALIEREQAALCAALQHAAGASQGLPLLGRLAALVDVAIAHQFGNAVYAAALDHEERRLPVQALLGDAQKNIVNLLAQVLRQHRAELSPGLPRSAAADCLAMTKALIENEPPLASADLPRLQRKVLRALLGYLLYRPATKLQT
jgi:AcrR family transcriptional regulator